MQEASTRRWRRGPQSDLRLLGRAVRSVTVDGDGRAKEMAVFTETVRWWLYRHGHASRVARFLNAAQARLAAAGVGPRWLVMVEVTGRRSGRTISFPAVLADYDNGRYLVSMLGEDTNWVRNVRASGGHAVLRHCEREPVMLQEVDTDQRAPILRCYLQRASGARAHIHVDRRAPVEEFEPIAAQYPVFRITAAKEAARQ
jgi:deazaflavin-dependent oxidoreductase (nitroreductase family)